MIAVLGEGVGEDGAARALGLGLQDQGESVVLAGTATSGDDVAGVLARAEEATGPLHGVVLASVGLAAATRGDLAGIGPDQWRQRVEVPLLTTLACFQGAYRRLRTRGGCLVVLVPTLGLVGSSGFAPWAAVAEGQRSLAKAAARAWGHEGITVNCVAVPAALLHPSWRGEDAGNEEEWVGPDRPGQPAPALLRSPDLRAGVAPVVASLVSGAATAVTGATVAVDGGIWMTP